MGAKTGERNREILHTLAQMLESPAAERITTAALAARLDVSEAALYRHFTGKAQMFEGLIDFIEGSLFGLINRITSEEKSAVRQIEAIVSLLLGFAQKNRGMTRVLIGDALVNEEERLQSRINQVHDRIEAAGISGRARRDGAGESSDELRYRALAPVRQERIQARPGRAVEQTVAAVAGRRHRLMQPQTTSPCRGESCPT